MSVDLHSLSETESRRLGELLKALRTPVVAQVDPSSWLLTSEVADEFQSRLATTHYFLNTVLFQDGFETALIEAARAGGADVQRASQGQRFWDAGIDGRTLSLKSSKAKDLRSDTLHISKLTEAAWIQDCRTKRQRKDRIDELFSDYTSAVDSILQLRYFHASSTYELVEIPCSVLQQACDLPLSCFASESPSICIPVGKDPADFVLKLDRSDAKITVTRIQKSRCVVHGTWIMA